MEMARQMAVYSLPLMTSQEVSVAIHTLMMQKRILSVDNWIILGADDSTNPSGRGIVPCLLTPLDAKEMKQKSVNVCFWLTNLGVQFSSIRRTVLQYWEQGQTGMELIAVATVGWVKKTLLSSATQQVCEIRSGDVSKSQNYIFVWHAHASDEVWTDLLFGTSNM